MLFAVRLVEKIVKDVCHYRYYQAQWCRQDRQLPEKEGTLRYFFGGNLCKQE